MCGVSGAFFLPPSKSRDIVRKINSCQEHRGPDAQSEEGADWFTLGHTRLSINALGLAGQQPLKSSDGRWLVSFNGEIYNHQDLRREFNLSGLTASDGAVIPEMISRYGPESIRNFRGMFAFVAVDLLARQVIAAVDPFAIKPLYWSRGDQGIVVASEPLSLIPYVRSRQIDTQAVANFLHRGALDNSATGFSEVHRVRPGSWVRFDKYGQVDEGSTIPTRQSELIGSTWADAAEALRDSVVAHLLSDVPVAVLLSDGVDSTALTVEMVRAGAEFTAITVDLGGGIRSEARAASEMCAQLGIRHEVATSTPKLEQIDDFFAAMQRPTIDGLNTYLVCGEVRRLGFLVALSGLGGDEILSGYASVGKFQLSRLLRHLPPSLASSLLACSARGMTRKEAARRLGGIGGRLPASENEFVSVQRQVWSVEGVHQAVGLRPISWTPTTFSRSIEGCESANNFSSAQIDLYLTSQLLPDADQFSMAHSVELRVPFVDSTFAQTVFSIRDRKLGKADLVNELSAPQLSAAQNRPKQGFSLPMEDWLRTGFLKTEVARISSKTSKIREVVDGAFVDQAVASWNQNKLKWHQMWAIVVLNRWSERS